VSGPYDFRVLLAAPIWVIAIGFCLQAAWRRRGGGDPREGDSRSDRPPAVVSRVIPVVALGLVLLGVVPSARYLWDVSTDTHHQYLFVHRDVAVARVVQDIVAGSDSPSIHMKTDEFRRGADPSSLPYDTFVCPGTAYAVMHAYLHGYDDRRILAFCDQGNEALLEPEELVRVNLAAVTAQTPSGKPLKLIWEEHPNAEAAIALFKRYEEFGTAETLAGSVEGQAFALYVLTIPGERVAEFQSQLAQGVTNEGLSP
jgi:hypothetical protein